MAKSLGGNISESSLIKTAQSAQTTLYAYNDKAAADQWTNSAKTAQDYQNYQQYINSRISGLNALPGAGTSIKSQSQLLGLNQTLMSAQRTYASAEIGRQTVSVLYGDESNTDKYNKIEDLMNQAAGTGDASLYQQLDETRARLSETIQNEQVAAANKAAADASKLDNATYTQASNEHAMAQDMLKTAYQTGSPLTNPDGSPVKVQYQNGQPVLKNGNLVPDANGQPLQLNAQSYARLIGTSLQAQAQTIQQHIAATGDPNGTYAKDLATLQSGADYQKYATPQAMAEAGSSTNPFVTKITQNPDGSLSRSIETDKLQTQLVPGANGLGTQLAPEEGTVGGRYVETANIGSTPNSPTDRTSSAINTLDLKNNPVNIGGMNVSGYGQQKLIANPNQNALPNGKARSQNIYIAPDTSGQHSVLPLKADGTVQSGQYKGTTNYETTTPADFEQPGMPDAGAGNAAGIAGAIGQFLANKPGTPNPIVADAKATGQALAPLVGNIGQVLANKPGNNTLVNDLKSGAADVGGAVKKVANIGKDLALAPQLATQGISNIMGKLGFANQQSQIRQQQQAAASSQNNNPYGLSGSDLAAWNSWLSRNTPQALAAAQAGDARANAASAAYLAAHPITLPGGLQGPSAQQWSAQSGLSGYAANALNPNNLLASPEQQASAQSSMANNWWNIK